MLTPMLFIGCGGSGVRTLRRLRRELEFRLEVAGIGRESFPAVWQFLVVDVPAKEQVESELVGFADSDYVGLADAGISYLGASGVDERLYRTEETLRDFAQWRPNPEWCRGIDITIGAGQHRAVGRAVGANALMRKIKPKVRDALSVVSSPDAFRDANTVARALGHPDTGTGLPEVQVILVTSLGGGAGSGIFVDVADALRRMSDHSERLRRSVAVVYDPTVFENQNDLDASGIAPNSLAAMSEVVAGAWSRWDDFLYLPGAGDAGDKRGPDATLVFGASNGEFSLMGGDASRSAASGRDAVYEMVAQILANVATGTGEVSFVEDVLGNWLANSGKSTSAPSIQDAASTAAMKPVSSMGFARVSLGRARFGRYASERMTRMLVEKLIAGHEDDEVAAGRKTIEARVAELVRRDDLDGGLVKQFLIEARLNETGSVENDQVIDEIRPVQAIADCEQAVQKKVSEVVTSPASLIDQFGKAWRDNAIVSGSSDTRWELPTVKAKSEEQARAWASSIQDHVLDVVVEWLAEHGVLVTLEVLRAATEQIGKDFPRELRAEALELNTGFNTKSATAAAAIKQFKPGRRDRTVPTGVSKVLSGLVADRIKALSERDVREVAAKVLEDMAKNFMEPLLKGLADASKLLESEYNSAVFRDLSDVAVPSRLQPAPNELLIDEVDRYPDIYEQLVSAAEETEAAAAVKAFAGQIGDEAQWASLQRELRPWALEQKWVPGVAGATRSTAKVGFAVGVDDIRRRSLAWMKDGQSTLAQYLNDDLRSWLAEEPSSDAERIRRAELLGKRLDSAFRLAKPFVELNEGWLASQFGYQANVNYVMSPIPLVAGDSERAFKVLDQAVAAHISSTTERKSKFGASNRGDIDIYCYLDPLCPSGILSLSRPITGAYSSGAASAGTDKADLFWRMRRSRPLAEFIPLPRSSRLSIVRGWITARLLNLITIDSSGRSCTIQEGGRSFAVLPPVGRIVSPSNSSDAPWEWLGWALESSLLAQMLAASGDTGAYDALVALIRLGNSNGSDVPSEYYGEPNPGLIEQPPGLKSFGEATNVVEAMENLEAAISALKVERTRHYAPVAAEIQLRDLILEATAQLRSAAELIGSDATEPQGATIG